MLQIRLLYIGKTKFRWVQAGVQHYQKELKPFAKFDLHEVKAVSGRFPEAELMRREAMRFRGNIDRSESVICLDRAGQRFTSEAFARWLSSQTERGASLAFVIGGVYGLDPEFKRKAQSTMSLSPMTFPHDMVRLVFAEQLFRALSILHGHPYHKKTPTTAKR